MCLCMAHIHTAYDFGMDDWLTDMISESMFAENNELWIHICFKKIILVSMLAKTHFAQKSVSGLGSPLKSLGML